MKLNRRGGLAIFATAVLASSPGFTQALIPTELQGYYGSNSEAIKGAVATAENAKLPADKRTDAFFTLTLQFPRAALATAIRLSNDEQTDLAVDGVKFLSSAVVMMNHGPSLGLGDHSDDQAVPKATEALRAAVRDERKEVREIAAATLASMNDEQTLRDLQGSYKEKKISDIEALNYLTLAKPSVGADYVADLLAKGSPKAKTEAISYLSTVDQYRKQIKDNYLLNDATPVDIRAAAAKALAKNDPSFGDYAPQLLTDSKLPASVFNGLVQDMGKDLSNTVVKNVLEKALAGGKYDPEKKAGLINSIKIYETQRPEVNLQTLQTTIRQLNPT